jgi:pyrroline-5-carboxylate reductase
MIEALSDGAVKMGLPRTMAQQYSAQTVLGAAKMVLQTGRHPAQLKDDVCSAGGSTITGVHAMECGGIR